MKKLLKIFAYAILSLLLIISILVIAANLSQNKIVDIATKKISESINASIEIEDASFTFVKRFPYATIELLGLKVGAEKTKDANSKSQSGEDILTIKSAYVLLKVYPFIKGVFEVNRIEIDDAIANYKVDSLGRSNIDFLLNYYANSENENHADSSNSTSNILSVLDLKKIKLKNTAVYYVDDSAKITANLFFPSLDIKGKYKNEKFSGTVDGNIQLANCSFSNTNINRMENASVDFIMDYESDTLYIKSLEASTEGANMKVSGKVAYSDPLFTELAIESKKLELEKLSKYVPDVMLKEYGIEHVTGIVNLSGLVKGVVSDTLMPSVDFLFDLKNGYVKTKEYPIVKKIKFEGKVSNGNERSNKTTSINFKSFHAETETSIADFSLSLLNVEKPKYTLKSKLKINIDEFHDFIPDSIIQNISGEFIANLSTKGQIPDSINDNFINHLVNNTSGNADFTNFQIEVDSLHINDFSGSLLYTPKHLTVSELNISIPEYKLQLENSSFNSDFTGRVTQLQELGITFNSFYIESPQGSFWGSAKIENLEYPDFVLNANAKVDLAALKPFIPDTLIKDISGNMEAEISTWGKLNLDSIEQQFNDIVFKQSEISLNAQNISLTMPDSLQKISNLQGEAKMDKGTIYVSKMSGIAAGIDFSVDSTTISNVYNTVLKNQHETVYAQGNLKFGEIDYTNLAPFFPSDSSANANKLTSEKDTNSNDFVLEENLTDSSVRNFLFDFKGKIAAKNIKYEKVFLEDISFKFNVSDSVYIVDQFIAKAFDGSTNSSLRYSLTKNNRQVINLKNRIEKMDINKLLFAFDNFGYDSLMSYENISGIFSTDINSRFVFDADSLTTKDMRILGNFALKNGKLINYQPAMDVSKFTGIKELDNIEMRTLECNIFMFKNNIYVPITKIVSSSMDVATFGMQSMEDDYEYHIQLKLGEILKGKSQKLIERQNSSGDELSKDDIENNTVKLIYGYSDGKKKLGFATKKAQKQMALKIQVQQKILELIFHPTLVSFETGVK